VRAVEREGSAEHLERETRIADRAAHVDVVARDGARAQQRHARRHLAEGGDADVERSLRGVAADQLAAVRFGQPEQAPREALQEGFFRPRQGQRQRESERLRAARGQIAQIDCQRLVPEPFGRDGGQEVAALDQHVGRDRELHAGRRREQRAIVADAQRRTARLAREVAGDQVEFAERHRLTCPR
jgi:hypothetical protein